MSVPSVFCPIDDSRRLLTEAVNDTAEGCAPAGLCWLAAFERTRPIWFALIGRSDDFAEAAGIQFIRLQQRLWAGGFFCDQIAHLVPRPSLAWGVRIWREAAEPDDFDVIRAVARQCGYRIC